jgi:uncharacterized protein YqeY
MSLKDTIMAEMKAAMKAKEQARLTSIRMLQAAIQRKEVDERIQLDDAQVIAVAEKLIKQSRDAITQYEKAGRQELVDKEQADIDIWQSFLPEQLSDAEIDVLVAAAISETGASTMKDMGKVMGVLKPKLAGRADMGQVSAKIKAGLGG